MESISSKKRMHGAAPRACARTVIQNELQAVEVCVGCGIIWDGVCMRYEEMEPISPRRAPFCRGGLGVGRGVNGV